MSRHRGWILNSKLSGFIKSREKAESFFIEPELVRLQPDFQPQKYASFSLYFLMVDPQKSAVIIGPPGSGKSESLRHLQYHAALAFEESSTKPFPVYID